VNLQTLATAVMATAFLNDQAKNEAKSGSTLNYIAHFVFLLHNYKNIPFWNMALDRFEGGIGQAIE
jgi:hypothetical protein